jgi:methylmalonyl-CoA/ethylmalonyl-CoA epimerase
VTDPVSSELSLHHVGYVVRDIAGSIESFAHSTRATWDGIISEDPHQRVRVAFLTVRAQDAQIELVEPAGEDSPVSDFLRKGGGLHHVCYEVNDLELELAEFRTRGALIAKRPKPAVAFHGRRIAWVITREKLLIELLERTPE